MNSVNQDAITMRQPSKFWDRIAERYAKSPVADEAAYRVYAGHEAHQAVIQEHIRPILADRVAVQFVLS